MVLTGKQLWHYTQDLHIVSKCLSFDEIMVQDVGTIDGIIFADIILFDPSLNHLP